MKWVAINGAIIEGAITLVVLHDQRTAEQIVDKHNQTPESMAVAPDCVHELDELLIELSSLACRVERLVRTVKGKWPR